MEFGQSDFEASRKKSDEQFDKQAEERNKLNNLSAEEKVSGLDMAREEAEIVDKLIEREIELFKEDNGVKDEINEDQFHAIAENYPKLAGYSRKKLQAMIKNRLEELGRIRDEKRLQEKKKE